MDLTLYAGIFLILMFAAVRYDIVYGLPSTLGRSLTVFLIFFSFVLLPFLIEAFTRGYSLGKWAFNIKVVRRDGGIITVRHTLVRSLTAIVETYICLGFIAFMSTMFSPKATRLGDLAAGTIVVKVPEPVFYPPLVMPPTTVNPERFIAAVLVVLRDREYAKELRRQDVLERRREQIERTPFGI